MRPGSGVMVDAGAVMVAFASGPGGPVGVGVGVGIAAAGRMREKKTMSIFGCLYLFSGLQRAWV